jgi:hypothetical protein
MGDVARNQRTTMTTTRKFDLFRRSDKRWIPAVARCVRPGCYVIEFLGKVVGDVQKRSRTDWYAEVEVEGQFFNACDDSLADVLGTLMHRTKVSKPSASDAAMVSNLRARIEGAKAPQAL